MAFALHPDLHTFLLQNPFPSLSYLPLRTSGGGEEMFFFLQDEAAALGEMSRASQVQLSMYREAAILILRLTFPLQKDTWLQTPRGITWRHENEEVFSETEFSTPRQKATLRLLLDQGFFTLVFYDRRDFFTTRRVNLSPTFRAELATFLPA